MVVMNNYDYYTFKQAVVKTAAANDYDEEFVESFLKRAEEEYNGWQLVIAKVAAKTDDPQGFCKQAYTELSIMLGLNRGIEKTGAFGDDVLNYANDFGNNITKLIGVKNFANPGGLGGAIGGAGGGMLLGLILSQLFDIPLSSSLLLGALGGGALGYGLTGTETGRSLFKTPSVTPTGGLKINTQPAPTSPQGKPTAKPVTTTTNPVVPPPAPTIENKNLSNSKPVVPPPKQETAPPA